MAGEWGALRPACCLPGVGMEGERGASQAGLGSHSPWQGTGGSLPWSSPFPGALQCLTERKRQVGEAEVALTLVHVLKLYRVYSLCISYTVPPSQMRVQLGPPPKRQAGFPPLPLLPAVPSVQAGLCTQAQAGCPGLLCTVSCRGRWVPQSRVRCESCGCPLSVDACACLSGMPLQKPDDRAAP